VNRPDLEINKGFGEISSSQTENENQRISLMTLLRVRKTCVFLPPDPCRHNNRSCHGFTTNNKNERKK